MSPPDSPGQDLSGHRISPGDWPGLIARVDGTQLIIGGPGTGKTELLARRAAHLINSGVAPSDGVLALTFSRETAADLRERITALTSRSFGDLPVGTFHAFARALVEEHSMELLGSARPPTVLTTPEQVHFVEEMLSEESPEAWPLLYRRMLATRTLAEELADFVLRCGERRVSPEELAVQATARPAWAALPGFYERYLSRLRRRRQTDYTGLLLMANRALGLDKIGRRTAARFPYVLADEYQEATVAQVEILTKLVNAGCHLTVVADPHQTSFSFRGAERASVESFAEVFAVSGQPPPWTFRLDTSFRVPAEIMRPAAMLIGADRDAPTPAPHAGRVDLLVFDQETSENDWVASQIERLHVVEGVPYREMAVVTRASRSLTGISQALDRRRIPHARPGARLIDHPAVRLALDLAWAAAVDSDAEATSPEGAAVDRIVESALLGPLFAMTQGRARELSVIRRREGLSWSETLSRAAPGAGALARLLGDSSWAKTPPATTGFWKLWSGLPQFRVLVETDLLADYRSTLASFAQTLGRLADRSPRTSLLDYRKLTLEGDLEASPLLPSHRRRDNQVTVSTIHQSKGLQFEVVFVPGAVDGVFPDTRPYRSLLEGQFLTRADLDHSRLRELQLENELSLAYVAMTRAGRRVVWSATSPDLNEIRRTVSRFMLTLADRAGLSLGNPESQPDFPPVGRLATESYLRRTQRDIHQPLPRRLAATMTLAHPPRQGLWNARGFAGVRLPGPDLGLVDPGHIMSASQAEAYHTCPRRYALERRLRLGMAENNGLRFGKLIHSVLESTGRRTSAAGESGLDLPDALMELEKQLEDLDFGTPVQNAAWLERGMQLLDQLEQRWDPRDGRAVGFEEEVDIEMGGTRWRGRVDRVDRLADGGLRIVDYKTSKNPITHKEAAVSLQLGFYLWAMPVHDPDLSPGTGVAELWYPLCEKGSWKRSFSSANLAEVVEKLQEIASAIVTEAADPLPWQPKPSKQCGRCRVRSLCPAWPEGQGAFAL